MIGKNTNTVVNKHQRNPKGAFRNRQFKEAYAIFGTRHRAKTKRTKNTTQHPKKMYPPKQQQKNTHTKKPGVKSGARVNQLGKTNTWQNINRETKTKQPT